MKPTYAEIVAALNECFDIVRDRLGESYPAIVEDVGKLLERLDEPEQALPNWTLEPSDVKLIVGMFSDVLSKMADRPGPAGPMSDAEFDAWALEPRAKPQCPDCGGTKLIQRFKCEPEPCPTCGEAET